MATLMYKGYTGVLDVDLEAGELVGRTIGMRDLITFQGRTVEEARKSFEESIDFYLACCHEDKKQPDRPYSGRFNVRISPEVHRRLVILAESRGQSLNELVSVALTSAAGEVAPQVQVSEPSWQEVKTKLEAQRPKAKGSQEGRRHPVASGSSGQSPRRRSIARPGAK
ncbi:MAG: type II toxin-antitoxin system HicB family antitoxin [Isosphaeraceae bacterium]